MLGTGGEDQTYISYYRSLYHKIFFATCVCLTQAPDHETAHHFSLFLDLCLFVEIKNARRMHFFRIAGLKGYEEVSVTVMSDSLRLGLRVTMFN